MNRILPPGSKAYTGIDCIWDHDKERVVNSTEDVIGAINKHWSKTFSRTFAPDRQKMHEWLEEFPREFEQTPLSEWIPTRDDVFNAIRGASHSAAGPDGIPFEAFKAVPDTAADVIHAIIEK